MSSEPSSAIGGGYVCSETAAARLAGLAPLTSPELDGRRFDSGRGPPDGYQPTDRGPRPEPPSGGSNARRAGELRGKSSLVESDLKIPMPAGATPPRFSIPTNWTFQDRAVAEGFERHVREQLPWYELATGAVAHVARHYIPEGGLVYDLGASTGNMGTAISETLLARKARLVPIESSPAMAALYRGPQHGNLLIEDARKVQYEPFDLAIVFLTMMFIPVGDRPLLLRELRENCKQGGAIIVFDKTEAAAGYPATVLWRLALAGKVATGVPAEDIVAKELSLGGVQRPIVPASLGIGAVEFFRFGEFAGWIVEP